MRSQIRQVPRAFRLEWFDKEFPDDVGEPGHFLCWSLALHRADNEIARPGPERSRLVEEMHKLER